MSMEDRLDKAAELQAQGYHDAAIDLLETELAQSPEDDAVRRPLALACAGKAEKLLGQADQLGQPPDAEKLDDITHLLDRAIELDAELGDAHWDKAVVAARFLQRLDEAAIHLNRAIQLGYNHPMMPTLMAMIEQDQPEPPPDDDPPPLLALVIELVNQAQGPNAGILDAELGLPGIRTLKDYCEEGTTLINEQKVDAVDFRAALNAAAAAGGDAAEYALDFMRRIAPTIGDPDLIRAATEAHLQILIAMAQTYRGWVEQEGARALRRTRRAARRGLDAVDACPVDVDPNLRAELMLAYGGSYAHPADANLYEAFRLYLDALTLKRQAQLDDDVTRLQALLGQMCDYQIQQTRMSLLIGGIGEQLETLKLAYRASRETGNPALATQCGLDLAEAFGQVNQPAEALTILEVLAADKNLNADEKFQVDFTLAARLSETRRPSAIRRAREIGERQVGTLADGEAPVAAHTLWMNLGNFRRLDDDVPGAREAFLQAVAMCPEPGENEVPLQRGQIRTLLAEAECLLDNHDETKRLLVLANGDHQHATGVSKLHFESTAARLSLDIGDPQAAAEHADRGIATRRFILEKGPAPSVWESMLQEWTRLDVTAVRARHQFGGEDALRQALLTAEAAKGRLFAWFTRARQGDKAPEYALSDEFQEKALATVEAWTKGAGRWVVSFFAHKEGMSITAAGPDGKLQGRWLDSFDYDDLRLRVFEPLENATSDALEHGNPIARDLSSAVVEMLLTQVGNWLWSALPDLQEGGDELVLLPHRLLRSLPLSHALLPNGKRLSELFDRVCTVPNLRELATAIDAAPRESDDTRLGLLDSDTERTLPFAQLEGLVALGADHVLSGDQVTVNALAEALHRPGMLLISCHGDFNEQNPWQSRFHAADGSLVLGEQLLKGGSVGTQLAVLGICEAGKSRRTLSDEPVSFPSFLITLGARQVIAPMWQVDDFTSYLFITRLFEQLAAGVNPARATTSAAAWLRSLTAAEALRELEKIEHRLAALPLTDNTRHTLERRMAQYRRWLAEDLDHRDYAFDALDWAAFQVHGYALSASQD